MFVRHSWRLVLIALSGMAWGVSAAVAGNVAADVTIKDPVVQNNLTGNSSAFFLWANLTGPGTNVPPNDTSYIQEFTAAGKKVIADPIPASKMLITVGKVTYPDVGGQKNVGQTKIAKPPPPINGGGNQIAVDSSFGLGAKNNIYIMNSQGNVTTGNDINGKPVSKFSAQASRGEGAQGSAAAATWDPGKLTPPSSGYFPLSYVDHTGALHDVYSIDATLGPTTTGERQAVEFMATDSRFGPATITNLGDPASNLWTLTISADKPLKSPADLNVSFQINPLATQAGGGTQDILTDSNGDPLSPGAVISRVLGAITVTDGVATLAAVDPFPVGTEYHVDQTITYGVADLAGVTAVPEPPSVWLLGLGMLGLLGYTAGTGERPCRFIFPAGEGCDRGRSC
jgi:hypothetical protein